MAAGLPPVPALDPTVTPGQEGHIADHDVIHATLDMLRAASGLTVVQLAASLAHLFAPVIDKRTFQAADLGPSKGSPSYAHESRFGVWLLGPDPADEALSILLDDLPANWEGQTIQVYVLVAPTTDPGTDSVRLMLDEWASVEGSDAGGINGTLTSHDSTVFDLSDTEATQTAWVLLGTFEPTASHYVRVGRYGPGPGDTYGDDLAVVALRFVAPFLTAGVTITDSISSWWSIPSVLAGDVSTVVTGVQANGDAMIGVYDGGVVTRYVLSTPFPADDHNTPVLVHRADDTWIVFTPGHQDDNLMRYREATDLDELPDASVETVTFPGGSTLSYAMAYEDTGGDLHLFTRIKDGDDESYYYAFNDGTWSTPIKIVTYGDDEHSYMTTRPGNNPNFLRCAIYGHPSQSTIHEIRTFEINLLTGDVDDGSGSIGNIRTATGTPFSHTDFPVIYDPDAEGKNIRLFEVSRQGLIAFCEWDIGDDTPPYPTARYCVLDPDGTKHDLGPAGSSFGHDDEAHYHGGMAWSDDDTLVLSRESSGVWSIEQWDDIGGWVLEEILDSSTVRLIRPRPVWGYDGDNWRVTWQRVTTYNSYTDYASSIRGI